MKPSLILAGILAAQFASQAILSPAHAESKRPEQEQAEVPDTSSIKSPSPAALEQIFNEATSELKAVEALMQAKSYGPAMLASKKIVDRVSIVNPKGKFSESIKVKGIISNADLKKTYSSLNNRQKESIAIAVAAHKGGFYLDLLNLAKRAKLMYLRSMYNQMREQLMERDILKLKEDLIEIHNIAIKISDSQAVDSFMVFDMDVANPDQQYFFNRELLAFAVEVQELKLTERGFDDSLAKDRLSRLQEHWAGVPEVQAPQKAVSVYETASYKACFSYFHTYRDSDRAKSTSYCARNAPKYDFTSSAFASCFSSSHNYNDSDRPLTTSNCQGS